MQDQIANAISNLKAGEVASIVEQICGKGFVAVGSPIVRPIGKKSAGGGTLGIFHVAGEAEKDGRQLPWSVVVKAIGGNEGFTNSPPDELEREIEVYRSGVFLESRGGFRAARCYLVQEIDDNSTWLWLEDLTEALHAPWPGEQYPVSAQHLGAFNAAWIGQSLPDWDWLSSISIRDRWRGAASKAAFEDMPDIRNAPYIKAVAPTGGIDRFLRHWTDGEQLISVIDGLEKGIAHYDAHPKNFFILNHQAETPITVAVDWPKVGTAPLGTDLGLFVYSPLVWLEISADDAKGLVEPIFDGYMRGIRNAGWNGNESLIRMSYLASIGVDGGNSVAWMAHRAATDDNARDFMVDTIGHPIDQLLDGWREALEFFLKLTDDALQLVSKVTR